MSSAEFHNCRPRTASIATRRSTRPLADVYVSISGRDRRLKLALPISRPLGRHLRKQKQLYQSSAAVVQQQELRLDEKVPVTDGIGVERGRRTHSLKIGDTDNIQHSTCLTTPAAILSGSSVLIDSSSLRSRIRPRYFPCYLDDMTIFASNNVARLTAHASFRCALRTVRTDRLSWLVPNKIYLVTQSLP